MSKAHLLLSLVPLFSVLVELVASFMTKMKLVIAAIKLEMYHYVVLQFTVIGVYGVNGARVALVVDKD